MNNERDVYARLLNGYPKKVLSDHFDIQSRTKDEVVNEIIESNRVEHIQTFAQDYFNQLKQHVYLYDRINLNFDRTDIWDSDIFRSGQDWSFHLKRVIITVVDYVQLTRQDIHFLRPMMIRHHGNYTALHLSTLERKLQSLFDGEIIVPKRSRNISDSEIINTWNLRYDLVSIDLTRGIKEMWRQDIMDAREIKVQESHSMQTQRMDEEFTFKQMYPEKYRQVINDPLPKFTGEILDREYGINYFICFTELGKLNIPNYSDNNECLSNLIRLILENNEHG